MSQAASSVSDLQNPGDVSNRSSPMSKIRLASHPLPTLTGNGFQFPVPIPLPYMSDHGSADSFTVANLKSRVLTLEAQLAACSSELARAGADLASTKQDLDRDEIIFASKLEEISGLHEKLEQAKEASVEYEATIAQLRHRLQDDQSSHDDYAKLSPQSLKLLEGTHKSVR